MEQAQPSFSSINFNNTPHVLRLISDSEAAKETVRKIRLIANTDY